MFQLKKIAGLELNYTSNIELTATGNPGVLEIVKNMLTITNVSIKKQIADLRKIVPNSTKHGFIINQKIQELAPKEITQMWAENEDGSLSIPPGYWFLGDMKSPKHENRTIPALLGDERYYQKEIVEEMLKYKRSCVTAATGVGKSLIIRDLVLSYAKAGKRILICVPSIELLDQTADAVNRGLDSQNLPKCSKMGNGKKPKDGSMVVMSTIQSAINIVDRFDVIIFDELHVVGAESYQAVAAGALNAEYMHGLTATIDRADGLTPLIYAWCGKIVYEYTYKKAVSDGFLSPIRFFPRVVESKARVYKGMHSVKEYIAVHSDKTFIDNLEQMVRKSLNSGRKTLVLFKASECCDALAARLGVPAANGTFRKPLEDFKQGKSELLIGNIALLSTGWDYPPMSCIFFVAAGSSEITFMQSCGRGTRLYPGKKDCIVIDVSADHNKYINQGKVRTDLAKRVGYEIG